MKYEPKYLDYNLSPYTGMTRESWIDAAKYLLGGIFRNIPSETAPVLVPRTETEITYPHKDARGDRLKLEEMAQRFEGLARSFLIAAPLIHDDPNVTVCGIKLREYYSRQILMACDGESENYIGRYEDLVNLTSPRNERQTFQQTVETCALVICLDICRDEIWLRYTKAERDSVASLIASYAKSATVPQNWRMFNMLDLAFLHKEGYAADKNVMLEHAQAILNYYVGGGWYRDGQSFDYYSCWAFNVYLPIWNKWYGYENEPYLARRFEENANALMLTYPNFFDRDGFTNMWGRSGVYRNAATSPLAENFVLRSPHADPGLARRIMSGSLLQFFERDDFLNNGVPTMGFYGEFAPMIQGYSCAESAYWLGKTFLCLEYDENHPFWTATENNGAWDGLRGGKVKETTLDGPGLCFTNHGANGTTILRTGKVVKAKGDEHGIWNYGKLAYNSKYPWEAAVSPDISAMQYTAAVDGAEAIPANVTLWHGIRGGVLYRRQFFGWRPECEAHWTLAVNLADFPVKYGIMRADKLRLFGTPIKVTLAAYGFPNDTECRILRLTEGNAKALVFKGYDRMHREKQMAFTIYDGWDEIEIKHSSGTNPESKKSIVPYAVTKREKLYGYENFVLISQVITKEAHEDFARDEIFPLSGVQYTDREGCGGYGPVVLRFKDGTERTVIFEGIESSLTV